MAVMDLVEWMNNEDEGKSPLVLTIPPQERGGHWVHAALCPVVQGFSCIVSCPRHDGGYVKVDGSQCGCVVEARTTVKEVLALAEQIFRAWSEWKRSGWDLEFKVTDPDPDSGVAVAVVTTDNLSYEMGQYFLVDDQGVFPVRCYVDLEEEEEPVPESALS